MERSAVNLDDQPELRLVRSASHDDSDTARPSLPETRDRSELVAELVGEAGLLPAEKLEELRAKALGGSFSQALVDEGLASSLGIARTLAEQYHLPLVVLERAAALPFAFENGTLRIAITDPQNVRALDELRLATRHTVAFHVAAATDVLAEIRRLSRASGALNAVLIEDAVADAAVGGGDEGDDLEADDGISDAPLVRLVNSIIFQAAEEGASDVHFEPQEHAVVVRFRVDGVLRVVQRIPKQLTAGVTTRLKVLAKLDIAERRRPQDGRITLNAAAAGRQLDIRVATLPTVEGESVTMRLLDKSKSAPTLEELGLSDEMRAQLSSIVSRPTGALLVTGPTGSGKSTTLYASLTEINRPEVNIITVEDPVEYRLEGINQVQINLRAGLTFATALRSILRSDPDVVMVGEIRDGETAKISIEAALTGHLVLSTLHTNDAPGALARLNEMGVEPFITGAAVSAVLAQRLARRLCPHCAEPYLPSRAELLSLRVDPGALEGVTFHRRKGCARCADTGYRGRVGIFQFLEVSERLEQLAAAKASREEIERAAQAEGMHSLWDDGVAKVAAGLTSVEELTRVLTV
jgi:type IV pilus assembly protein PilB